MFAQLISCALEEYLAHRAVINKTIQHAVADSIAGLAPKLVTKVNMVFAGALASTHAHLLRGAPEAHAAGNSSVLTYEVISPDPEVTFEDLKSQIQEATDNGVLAEKVHQYAVAFTAPQLTNATVGPATVTQVSEEPRPGSDSDSKEVLSREAIIGITVGGFFFLLIVGSVAVGLYRGCHNRK